MLRKFFLFFFAAIIGSGISTFAQSANLSTAQYELDTINRNIDNAVVSKNEAYLEKAYTDDFIFTHGTGHIDSKQSWLADVLKPTTHFISRVHDSTVVEIHNATGIIYGRLTVHRQDGDKIKEYIIKYVRVFHKEKNHWQMISHRTVWESDI